MLDIPPKTCIIDSMKTQKTSNKAVKPTLHIYKIRYIKNEVHNIKKGDFIYLDTVLCRQRWSTYFEHNKIDERKLCLTYITEEQFFKLEGTKGRMFDFSKAIIKGNPPYNDGSAGRSPIYQNFLGVLARHKPEGLVFIIPTNWFSQDNSKLGKDVRRYLKDLGLNKIEINPIDMFEGALVATCTVFCTKGYVGDIDLVEKVTGKSRVIEDFSKPIVREFDDTVIGMLKRLKPETPFTTHQGTKGNTDKYRIATSYQKIRFDLEPLSPLKIIEPNYKSQGGYRVFAECDSLEDAEKALVCLSSFWHSKLVKTIMRKTRTSTTLDNPQLRWVPTLSNLNKVYTDKEIYKLLNCNKEEIKVIEDDNQ